jgi:hypothetical protein
MDSRSRAAGNDERRRAGRGLDLSGFYAVVADGRGHLAAWPPLLAED